MTSIKNVKRADRAAALERRGRAAAVAPGAGPVAAGHLVDLLGKVPEVETVSAYLPIGDELDPLPAMQTLHAGGYRLCVPVIVAKGQPLRFREWVPGCPLVTGPFGVSVPETGDWLVPDAMLVPLLAFDRAGNRLGYGGGFYDRTIAALRRERAVYAIGFAFSGQEVEAIPLEATDEPLDALVSEAGATVLRAP